MVELLHEAIAPVNIVYTGLFMLILLYWLSVILGALDFGTIDFNFDVDADFEIDANPDVDTDLDAGGAASWLAGALHFFNFGKLPFMVILTILTMCLWFFSITLNYYWGNGSVLFALAILFPMLFVSLTITKVLTTPLIPIFKGMDGIEDVDYIGLTCKLLLPASAHKMGQAEVYVHESFSLINVLVTEEKDLTIEKGSEAVIIAKSEDKDLYIIDTLKEI